MTPVVAELADRAEITSLVSRYFSAIDDMRLDRATMESSFCYASLDARWQPRRQLCHDPQGEPLVGVGVSRCRG